MADLAAALARARQASVAERPIALPLRRVYYANSRAEASQIGFDDGFIYGEVARVPELRKIPHFRLMTDDAQVAVTVDQLTRARTAGTAMVARVLLARADEVARI